VSLLAALSCVGGGALWALTPLGIRLSEQKYKTPDVFWKLFPSAPLLLLLGLAGIFFLFAGRHGWFGRTGFFVTFLGLVLIIAGGVGQFWLGLDDTYMVTAPAYRGFRLGLIVLSAGSIVLGIAAFMARTLPRWVMPVFVLGAVGALVAVSREMGAVGAALWIFYGACWALLGLALLVDTLLSYRRKKRGDKRAGY
jgi:hypothetical protein